MSEEGVVDSYMGGGAGKLGEEGVVDSYMGGGAGELGKEGVEDSYIRRKCRPGANVRM